MGPLEPGDPCADARQGGWERCEAESYTRTNHETVVSWLRVVAAGSSTEREKEREREREREIY